MGAGIAAEHESTGPLRGAEELLDARIAALDCPGRRDEVPAVGPQRPGVRACALYAGDNRTLENGLVARIREARERPGVSLGDLAVLVSHRADLIHYRGVLNWAGIPTVDLPDRDVVASDRVRIGTFGRVEELEFGYVFLPGLTEGPPEQWDGERDHHYRRRLERMRHELGVGMTRAREALWLGYLH